MKKLILLIILFLIAGCETTPMTPEERAIYYQSLSNTMQNINNQIKQQRMYDAQLNYYNRPYEVGGVIYVP